MKVDGRCFVMVGTFVFIGWVLLGFSIVSGIALFFNAVNQNKKYVYINEQTGTLWALFIIGLIGAIIIFSIVRKMH